MYIFIYVFSKFHCPASPQPTSPRWQYFQSDQNMRSNSTAITFISLSYQANRPYFTIYLVSKQSLNIHGCHTLYQNAEILENTQQKVIFLPNKEKKAAAAAQNGWRVNNPPGNTTHQRQPEIPFSIVSIDTVRPHPASGLTPHDPTLHKWKLEMKQNI